jgi:hypothetical protein
MRRPRSLLAAAFLGSTALACAAQAQDDEAKLRGEIETALASIQYARCGAERCAPASPDEIAAPPLTTAEAASVLDRGVVSGFARSCEMDWIKTSFQPMIDYWRVRKKNERQLALMGILHGMALGRTQAAIGAKPCTDDVRATIKAQLSTYP